MLGHKFSEYDEKRIRGTYTDFKVEYLADLINECIKESFNEIRAELMEQKSDEQPMTIADLADYLKVTKATIHNLKNKGIITGNKVGKNRYFMLSEVREALKKYRHEKYLNC